MNDHTPNPNILQTERILPYPPDAIYAAFADPDRLATWWGPNGFTNTFDVFDFKVGGNWQFTMHGPDGANYWNESVFRELEPGSKFVIQHLSAPHFTLSVSLLPDDEGTRILWIQAFEDPKVVAAIRHIVEPANEQNLDRLHANLSGL
ncbi:SRPBCC family protein [Chitinimonas naiadis]